MNMFSPAEVTRNFAEAGKVKASRPAGVLFTLAALAGLLIAFAGAAANTAAHGITNVSAARLVSGLIFPFGISMVMLTGAELMTGNCLMSISALNGDIRLRKMLRNWAIVYIGNFAGSAALAAGCAFFGQLGFSGGGLAVYTISVAAIKCAMPMQNAFVLGIFCNLLVCTGVLCGFSAKDTAGRIAGVYIAVSFFVICGFEHSIANMYAVPAGIFALSKPEYAVLAARAGVDVSALTWGNFLPRLAAVTLGNILGGTALGAVMWGCNLKKAAR